MSTSVPVLLRRFGGGAVIALLAGLWLSSHAQIQISGNAPQGFRLPIYVKPEGENAQPQLRAVVTGGATFGAALSGVVRDMVITSFADGATNVVARAAECLFDRPNSTATSTNTLQVDAGQGQLRISGRGFLLNLTNSTLFLSNDVRTVIQASVLDSARRIKPTTADQALRALPPPGAAGTNPPVLITSQTLSLFAISNIVVYQGTVQVRSAQLDLDCETLVLQRATNGSIRQIVAEQAVVVRSKETGGTAYGERALYNTSQGIQLLTLTGTPARWEAGLRHGQAGQFIFDLDNNTLQAEQDAFVRLPRQSLERRDWVLGQSAAPALDAAPLMVSIRAELLTVHLPAEFRPGHSVLAQTNVVMVNEEDGSQASADQAFYAEVTGTVELDGRAMWSSQDRMIRAHSLFLDRTNRTFRATGEAYLRLPVGSVSGQSPLPRVEGAAGDPKTSLEVYSRRYQYRDGVLRFQDDVRANLLETNRVSSRLTCRDLFVHGTNRLEQIFALGDVHLEQLPAAGVEVKVTQRNLDCQWLALLLDTNGHPDRIIARTNVVAVQYELDPAQPEPTLTRLQAQEVTAEFLPGTNQFKRILAERDVLLNQGLRTAYGQMALLENNLLTLTGQPTLDAPEGKITEASAIQFDVAANRFYVQQGRAEGTRLPEQNLTRPPR